MNKDNAHSMQDDTISRQAAIDAINRAVTKEMARWSVKELPSVEVEPVKRGKWLTEVYEYGKDEEEDKWVVCPAEDGDSAYCSLCGKSALLDGGEEYVLSPYCPNCGAKMEGLEA